jgi:hypothetical protein
MQESVSTRVRYERREMRCVRCVRACLKARLETAASAQPSALASTAAPAKGGVSPGGSATAAAVAFARGPAANVSSQRQRFFTCSPTGGYCSAATLSAPKKVGTPRKTEGRRSTYGANDDAEPGMMVVRYVYASR